MSPAPIISFVVIAHNEQAGIARALQSILAQPTDWPREVVVVDDGSEDATADCVAAVATDHPEVRLVRLSRNRGRGFARATGIAEATGRYIATVDADIVLPGDWLARCLEAIADADAVAGIAVPDGDVTPLYARFGLEPKLRSHTTDVTGSNALYRREIFDQITFDSRLREGEDVALSHALRRRTARVRTVPGLVVRHEESRTLRQSFRWMFQSGRGAARQLYRYREIRRPDLVFFGWVLVIGASVMGIRRRPVAGVAVPALYVASASAAHVSGAFVFRLADLPDFIGAVALDCGMLTAYFAGRTFGAISEVQTRSAQV